MVYGLNSLYENIIKNWSPPQCPDNFTDADEIIEYQENFKNSCLKHLEKELVGQVVIEKRQGPPENIGIITRVGLYRLSCEFAPEKNGGNWHSFSSLGIKTLDSLMVLEKLTSGQEARKKLILERITKNSTRK